MATQTFRFSAESGLTLTAQLFVVGSATAFAAAASCTEAARGGVYSFTASGTAGRYEVHIVDTVAGEKLGVLFTPLTTDTTTTYALASEPILIEIAEDAATAAAGGGGGGGSGAQYVFPLVSTQLDRVTPNRVALYTRELIPVVLPILDGSGVPVDCTGMVCDLLLANGQSIEDLSPTTVGDDPPHLYTFTPLSGMVSADRTLGFSLRVQTTLQVLAVGSLTVSYAP